MLTIIPVAKIEPNGIVIYNSYYTDQNKSISLYDRHHNLFGKNENTYSNFSIGSRKRLKRAFLLLHSISKPQTVYDPILQKDIKFQLNMITLTLSAKQGIHTDKTIKQLLLNDFLTRLRQQQKLSHYIWRAEPQVNNNIHFHIITKQYFNYQYIRDTWNNTQKKLGYIDLFNEKHHHINPNSTDVHAIRNIHNATAYVGKYIQKMLKNYRDIDGKYWDCSLNLKPKQTCSIDCIYEDFDTLTYIEEYYKSKVITGEHYKFIPLSHQELMSELPDRWLKCYSSYIQSISQES